MTKDNHLRIAVPSHPSWEAVQFQDADPMAQCWYEIEGKHCKISIQARMPHCDRGNWIARAETEPPLYLDGQDGWPRYYFDLDQAMAECEAWLQKRGLLFGVHVIQ